MIAFAVVVLERAAEHPRDDLHVAVAVRAETRGGSDAVVVVHDEQTVALVQRRIVLAEIERVLGLEPTDVGEEAIVWLLDCNGHGHLNKVACATIP